MKNIKNKKNKPVWQAPEEKQPCCPYCGSTDIEPNGDWKYICYSCNIEFDEDDARQIAFTRSPVLKQDSCEKPMLDKYLRETSSSTDVNKIEVTSLTAADLQGEPRNLEQSPLGKNLFVRRV